MAVESIMLGIAHWRRIVLIAWIWTCANVCGHAAQTRDQELAGSLLAGLRDHVESLRSGVVEFEVLDKNGRRVAKRFAAFDVKDGNLRSDTLENSRFADRIVKVICTKDQFVQFLDNKGDTKLIELNVGETSMVEDGSPIDLRALGMCSYSQMSQGASAEAILKALDKARVISASLENDIGVIVLDPNHADGETRLVWWIDTAHGYVPLRQEVRLGSNVCQKFETSWARMNGIMVPVRSAFFSPEPGGALECTEEMHFIWKGVNENVPEELFTVENLKLPTGTYVIDTRLGTPIVKEVVGLNRPLPSVPSPQRMSSTRMVVVIVGTFLLLVVVATLILRHRRASPRS